MLSPFHFKDAHDQKVSVEAMLDRAVSKIRSVTYAYYVHDHPDWNFTDLTPVEYMFPDCPYMLDLLEPPTGRFKNVYRSEQREPPVVYRDLMDVQQSLQQKLSTLDDDDFRRALRLEYMYHDRPVDGDSITGHLDLDFLLEVMSSDRLHDTRTSLLYTMKTESSFDLPSYLFR